MKRYNRKQDTSKNVHQVRISLGRISGKQVRKTFYVHGPKREAQCQERAMKGRLDSGLVLTANSVKVTEFLRYWLDEYVKFKEDAIGSYVAFVK